MLDALWEGECSCCLDAAVSTVPNVPVSEPAPQPLLHALPSLMAAALLASRCVPSALSPLPLTLDPSHSAAHKCYLKYCFVLTVPLYAAPSRSHTLHLSLLISRCISHCTSYTASLTVDLTLLVLAAECSFGQFDADDSGYIDITELRGVFSDLRAKLGNADEVAPRNMHTNCYTQILCSQLHLRVYSVH